MPTQRTLHVLFNLFGVLAISLVLTFAFSEQLTKNSIPCPLCLLQRASFTAMGLIMLANLKYGISQQRYGLLLLAAILGEISATRQILLHILPGQAPYGFPFMGIHLYTWSAILFLVTILSVSFLLIFTKDANFPKAQKAPVLTLATFWFLTLILLNLTSVFLACGFMQCPDDPVKYLMLT